MLYGLIGRKLEHSYSPAIHRRYGNRAYRLYELEPEELGTFLRRADLGGINVTMPYKRDVLSFCDELSPAVKAIGAANTLVRRKERMIAHNTDLDGFVYMLRRADIQVKGKKVVILGSGGASLSAQAACRELGAGEVAVLSRKGQEHYADLNRHRDAVIVINATPVGMYPHCPDAPVSLEQFPACEGVADVIYNPRRTGLLMEAEERGIPCCGGLSMLVAQAKAAHELFFDTAVPDDKTEEIIREMARDSVNIVLVGMPGSGKTAVGEQLARLSGRKQIDLDDEIVRAAGCSIPELFASQGESVFRELEHKAAMAAGKESGLVITAGGGVVVREDNYPLLHQNGYICHLTRDLERLAVEGRPLSADRAALVRLEAERMPLYRRFRDTTVANNRSAEEAAAEIWRDFCENIRD